MNRIAVLITCHNRSEKTMACLHSLFQCRLPGDFVLDVFLVDDGSTDGTAKLVTDRFPKVIIIHGDGNLYWNRGMHLAWSYASKQKYNFYLWLNDDTFLNENALTIILNDSKSKNNQSIICGICQSKLTSEISYGGYEKSTHKIINPNGQPQQCYFFNGNIVLIPQIIFEAIGNLDPFFQHGFGDFDYGLRAIKKNISSWVTSEIIGFCDDNKISKWSNPRYPFFSRLMNFYTPLGMPPFQHFVYAKRHWGLFKATKDLFSQHLRVIYPSFWINK